MSSANVSPSSYTQFDMKIANFSPTSYTQFDMKIADDIHINSQRLVTFLGTHNGQTIEVFLLVFIVTNIALLEQKPLKFGGKSI